MPQLLLMWMWLTFQTMSRTNPTTPISVKQMTQVRNNFYLLVYDISLFDYALEFQKLGTISNGRVQGKVFSKVLLVHNTYIKCNFKVIGEIQRIIMAIKWMVCVVFWLPVDVFYWQSDEKWRLLAQGSQVYLIVKEMVIDYTWSFHPQFIKDNSRRGKNHSFIGERAYMYK